MPLTIRPEKLSIERALKELGLDDRKPEELFGLISDAMKGPACALFEAMLRQERDWCMAEFMALDASEFGTRAAGLQGYMNGVESAINNWHRMATWARQRGSNVNQPKEKA